MARQKNNRFLDRWTIEIDDTTARKVIEFGQDVVTSKLFGNIERNQIILRGWPENITGAPTEALNDLKQSSNSSFESFKADIQANANRRVNLTINPGNQLLTLNIQQIEDAKLIERLIAIAKKYFSPLEEQEIGPAGDGAAVRIEDGARIDCYILEERLGSGFSAEVWRARVAQSPQGVELEKGDEIAIKIYFPNLLRNQFETIRIQREFEVASEVRHSGIVTVHDVLMSPSRGYSFIVMDYVDGVILKQFIPSDGLPVAAVIDVARQLFDALGELHSRSALHRDIKASNIIVTNPEADALEIVLLDLGIVQLEGSRGFTQTSAMMGSKHSAPLEQLAGREIDERTDLYGVGAALYHCLTGHELYHREGPVGAIVERQLTDPEQLAVTDDLEETERQLREFINSLISIDPNARPSSAADCLKFLETVPLAN